MFNVNCFTNGSVLLDWSIRSSRNLSSNYLNTFAKAFVFRGSCMSQQGDVHEVKTTVHV